MGTFMKNTMKILIVLSTFIAASFACTDIHNHCQQYHKRYCVHSWLKRNCEKYCGLCTPATGAPPACSDRYSQCSVYDKKKFCKHSWLKANCQNYCGYCNGTATH